MRSFSAALRCVLARFDNSGGPKRPPIPFPPFPFPLQRTGILLPSGNPMSVWHPFLSHILRSDREPALAELERSRRDDVSCSNMLLARTPPCTSSSSGAYDGRERSLCARGRGAIRVDPRAVVHSIPLLCLCLCFAFAFALPLPCLLSHGRLSSLAHSSAYPIVCPKRARSCGFRSSFL